MRILELVAALSELKNGAAVIIPTETVYGLAADATNEEACQQIYKIKGRPSDNPLILHFSNLEHIRQYAKLTVEAETLARLWPGPLTMILARKQEADIAKCVHGGRQTIAVRIPSYLDTLELITKLGRPIAAPSANKSGRISPTKIEHLITDYGHIKNAPAIFKSSTKQCVYGLESTIIDLTSITPRILRPGFITPETISELLGKDVAYDKDEKNLIAPGMRYKHYAPQTQLECLQTFSDMPKDSVCLKFGSEAAASDAEYSLNLSLAGDLAEAAGNLYMYLHQLDKYAIMHKKDAIYYHPVPNNGIGIAINERLAKAAR